MQRALLTLVTGFVFSTVAAAQQPVRRSIPSTAPRIIAWQYGFLIFVEVPGAKPIGPIWRSADTTVFAKLDSAVTPQDVPGRPELTPLVRVLDVLGAQGWELVNTPRSRGEPYTFKRRVEK